MNWSIKEKISKGQITLFDYTEEKVKNFYDAITSGLKNNAGVEEKDSKYPTRKAHFYQSNCLFKIILINHYLIYYILLIINY